MRPSILIAAIVLAGSPALASSIDRVTSVPRAQSKSVEVLHCDHCPPIKVVVRKSSYITPELEPGTQTTEIREVNGEKKLVRTEAWLGGSPVLFMSKPPADAALAAKPDADAAIDATAKTSALPTIDNAASTPGQATETAKATAEIDSTKFELRLN